MVHTKLPTSHICLKRDTENNFLGVNPIVLKGEVIFVDFDDCVKIKVGDGITHFRDLEYLVDPTEIKRLKREINDLKKDMSFYMIIAYSLISLAFIVFG